MILKSDKKVIGEIFKKHRKKLRLTQFELAEKVDLSEKQISRIELGQNCPTYLIFAKLVQVLDIDINEFVSNTSLNLNSVEDELMYIIRNADDSRLKMYLAIIKSIEVNLK